INNKDMKELLDFIIRNILGKDSKFEITEEDDGSIVKLTVKTAEDEGGMVIGKQGKVIKHKIPHMRDFVLAKNYKLTAKNYPKVPPQTNSTPFAAPSLRFLFSNQYQIIFGRYFSVPRRKIGEKQLCFS
ncbi:MAG: hypothetical protein US61_C0023G0001, partial [Parcubacteria group bacterium GW2011_GWE2_37_8]